MLATLGGTLALLTGLAVMLLPLLVLELSRPRDSAWGALILLLGLVLVTSADRLTGAPMLAVLCGGLLIGRLGLEVGQGRWRQLSPEERQRLWSPDRWRQVLEQLITSIARLVQIVTTTATGLFSRVGARRRSGSGKLWVRPELPEATPASESSSEAPPPPGGEAAAAETPAAAEATAAKETAEQGAEPVQPESTPADTVREVSGFAEVDALLQQSENPSEDAAAADGATDAATEPRDGTG